MTPHEQKCFIDIVTLVEFHVDKQAEDGEIYGYICDRADAMLVATEAYIGRKQHEIRLA